MANKKVVSVLSTAAIGTLIATAVGSTVFAAVDGLVVKNAAGAYLNYDLDALKASVVNDALGQAGAELYKDFDAARTAGSIVSYHDDKVGFVDAAAVQKAALDAALAGTNFAVDTFTESSKETVLPATVYQATVKDGKVVAGAEVKPTSTPVATELKVDSVSAINAIQIEVKYNNAVEKKSAEIASNYVLSNLPSSSAAVSISKAELKDDKTVILTLNNAIGNDVSGYATNQSAFDVTISSVRDTQAKEINKITFKNVKFFDVTLPVAESVALVGPRTLEVTFSEPLLNAGTYTLDGGIYSATVSGFTPGAKKVTVQLGTTLAKGEHTLKIKASEDYVKFKVTETELKFNYDTVSAFPNATVKSVDEKSVTLVFDAPVYNFSQNNFYHDYTGWTAKDIYLNGSSSAYGSGIVTEASAAKEVKVVFATGTGTDYPLTGSNKVVFLTKVGSDEVKDLWSNKLTTDLTFSVVANPDNTKPVVEDVKATAQNKFEVKFSEEVTTATAEDESNYTVLNSKGEKVTNFTATYSNNDKKVTLTFDSDLKAGSYDVTVKGIKDKALAANTANETKFAVAVSDLKGPDATLALIQGSKLLVQFADDSLLATTGQNSILEKGNYQYDGKALPSGATLTLGNDSKSVIIDFTNTNVTLATSKTLEVARVADVNGNTSVWFSKPLTTASASTNAPKVKVTSGVSVAKATATNTVVFDVDQPLTSIAAGDFTIGGNPVASATYTNNNDGTATVTLVVADTNKWATGATPSLVIATSNSMKNQLGTALNPNNGTDNYSTGANVLDRIAPAIAKDANDKQQVYALDTDSNGKLDTFVVEYTETLDKNFVAASTFTVEGYTVTNAYAIANTTIAGAAAETTAENGKYAVIKVTEKTTADTGVTPKVTQAVAVKDIAGNALAAQAASDSIDIAAPVLVSQALATDDKTLTLTFSENVENALASETLFRNAIAFAADGATFSALNVADALQVSDKTITITFNSALTGNTNAVKIAANALKDKATTANTQTAAVTTTAIDATAN